MARIPEEELERLKKEIALERLVEARGVQLKRHGADLIGLCPFHDDKDPSLVISPAKNLWHCLGACQTGGSVIDWVMRSEGVSFRHAVELLRADAPLGAQREAATPPKASAVRRLPAPVQTTADDAELLGQVIDFYHQTLKASPEALAYLEQRGLKHPDLIEHFKLGYANRTLGLRLPQKAWKEGEAIRGRLRELGIFRRSGHEHLNGSLVIPVFDAGGQVVEIYGRKILSNLRKGTPAHLYLPGPHRGIFNRDALSASKEIILCESLIDALTFWCAGFRNVTSSFGIEGFTDELMEAFEASGTERVLIAYDRDDAGERAATKLAERLMAAGLECFRVLFPRGQDANDYSLQVTPAERSLALVLRKAEWMGTGAASARPSTKAATPKAKAELTAAPAAPAVDEGTEEAAQPATPASPAPESKPPAIDAHVTAAEVVIEIGDRSYRVRGLAKNLSYEVMKVNVAVRRRGDDRFHLDTLELYSARHRAAFCKEASLELACKPDVIKKDLGKVLLKLEELQDEQIRAALEPAADTPVTIDDPDRDAALELLRDPRLLERILEDFERCGVVGEETNKLVGYLAAVSRKLDEPLAVIIQSSSAAGKTSLMDAVLAFMPEEERVQYSAMTGQSLFYMGETNLSHKILAIVEEEGADRASYALKLLQSEGELTIASTGKDPQTGRLETQEYHVEGPVMILLTTTAIDLDEELLNRCLVLSVDEGRAQTRAIHDQQRRRRTLSGLRAKVARRAVRHLHRNAQRLLRPLAVMNPFAPSLRFEDSQTRTRRDHEKYLTLIDSIALLHQHQRPVKSFETCGEVVQYVEVERADIETANRLAGVVLARSLDELPPQTRRLLEKIDAFVSCSCDELEMDRCDFRFTRRDIREETGVGNTQLMVHMQRLEEMEFLIPHRGGRGQSYIYELNWHPDGEPRGLELGEPDGDGLQYDEKFSGSSESFRGDFGGFSGRGPKSQSIDKTRLSQTFRGSGESTSGPKRVKFAVVEDPATVEAV